MEPNGPARTSGPGGGRALSPPRGYSPGEERGATRGSSRARGGGGTGSAPAPRPTGSAATGSLQGLCCSRAPPVCAMMDTGDRGRRGAPGLAQAQHRRELEEELRDLSSQVAALGRSLAAERGRSLMEGGALRALEIAVGGAQARVGGACRALDRANERLRLQQEAGQLLWAELEAARAAKAGAELRAQEAESQCLARGVELEQLRQAVRAAQHSRRRAEQERDHVAAKVGHAPRPSPHAGDPGGAAGGAGGAAGAQPGPAGAPEPAAGPGRGWPCPGPRVSPAGACGCWWPRRRSSGCWGSATGCRPVPARLQAGSWLTRWPRWPRGRPKRWPRATTCAGSSRTSGMGPRPLPDTWLCSGHASGVTP
ncbi:translation initiation factor IF-2-like isoform X3 [Corvus kubaryi]|uniref:translation initiation factor IF-2-like isoform X3 n=1 Tax=Corvus kubaryi TaxID=68294 RepID=UPI001C05AB80|nr:translation initiation factor IF-2-like isoform X3 [Corvus kubaryi]